MRAPLRMPALTTLMMLMALLSGCASSLQPPGLAHGEATRRVLAMQRLDAEAGHSRQPASGMDGRSAAAAQQRYQKSFSDAQHDSAPIVSGK